MDQHSSSPPPGIVALYCRSFHLLNNHARILTRKVCRHDLQHDRSICRQHHYLLCDYHQIEPFPVYLQHDHYLQDDHCLQHYHYHYLIIISLPIRIEPFPIPLPLRGMHLPGSDHPTLSTADQWQVTELIFVFGFLDIRLMVFWSYMQGSQKLRRTGKLWYLAHGDFQALILYSWRF